MDDPSLIEWVSPSAVARLQACGLAESRRRGHSEGAQPSSPGARLGTAAHRVLEWIARSAPELSGRDDAEDVIAARWTEEIDLQRAESESNALERSYGPPQRWPAYGRIAAGVKVDGVALADELANVPFDRRLPEVELASSDRTIRGTADLIVVGDDGGALIVDHKTGDATDDDVAQGGRYEQQVLLYVAMARDSGLTPTTAEIRPLGRPAKTVTLSDDRVAEVVETAHAEMRRYNEAVAGGRSRDLARPSHASCEWCPYILDCAALWDGPRPDLGDLAVLEGVIETVQVLETSVALRIATQDGVVTVTGAPAADINGCTPSIADRVRIAGLRQTAAGVLRSHPGRVHMIIL